MFGPNGIFSERHRGRWLLACGSSWMLLFVYGMFKLLWLREWGYACVTGGVIACGPVCVWLTLAHRARRERDEARAALAAAEAARIVAGPASRAAPTPIPRIAAPAVRPAAAPLE
jgi:F0F1-type ATP synthase assembly protein I